MGDGNSGLRWLFLCLLVRRRLPRAAGPGLLSYGSLLIFVGSACMTVAESKISGGVRTHLWSPTEIVGSACMLVVEF